MGGYRRVDDNDEGPSADDLARFGHETAYCPHCGAEVWDDAQQCPSCQQWMEQPAAINPRTRAIKQAIIVGLLLLGGATFLLLSLCSGG
jgi:hypothetical protein